MSSGENMGKITTGGLELGKSSRMVDFPAMFDSQRFSSPFLARLPGLLSQERLPKKIPKKAAHPVKVNEEEAPICKKQPGFAYLFFYLFLQYIFPHFNHLLFHWVDCLEKHRPEKLSDSLQGWQRNMAKTTSRWG